jgi:hypothetical protein
MIWLILSGAAATAAIVTYTETDWEYSTDRTLRRARAFFVLMTLLSVTLLADAWVVR